MLFTDPPHPGAYGLTAAHIFAGKDEKEELLLHLNEDMSLADSPDAVGRTPIFFAIVAGSSQCLELLLRYARAGARAYCLGS